jgi:hypothetical protein
VAVRVGGDVDEVRVTLALHGADLNPEEISALLGCSPTRSHRKGEARTGRSASAGPWKAGAWLLTIEGRAPRTANELLAELLQRVPDDEKLWSDLGARYSVSVGFGLFLDGWNRGLDLEQASIQRLARMKVSLGFDIYADAAFEDPAEANPEGGGA